MDSTTRSAGVDPGGTFSPAKKDFPDRFPWGRWAALCLGLGLVAGAIWWGR